MNESKLKYYHQLISDLWHFIKDHSAVPIGENDTYWAELVFDASDFTANHGGDEFARELIVDVCSEFERQYRKQRKEAAS